MEGLGSYRLGNEDEEGEIWYQFQEAGVVFVVERRTARIETIFLDAPGPRSPLGFRAELPCGLFFSMRRREVLRRLGAPHFKQTQGSMRFDAWERDGYVLHVHYAPDETIAFVALLPLDLDD